MPEPHGPRDCVVAPDVGGTGMKGALLHRTLTPSAALSRPTPRRAGPEAVVGEIVAALHEPVSQAAARQLTVRQAVTVAPGIIDEEAGRAVYSADLDIRPAPLTPASPTSPPSLPSPTSAIRGRGSCGRP
ncbi:hypothetical protein [Streptomyces sp. NPDC018833]|uniref:hypothetical protein n=1 Tax=Streptomyces sp. NPDC018833 TaxID=3365053 RepID=UPI0037B345A0